MSATIVREATAKFTFNTPSPNTEVDVSCYVTAVELGSETEEIDVATFCNPSATDLGRTTNTAVLSMLWEPALYAALSDHVKEEAVFEFAPDVDDPDAVISFTTRFGALPWGRFEIGQRVEVDLALAVLSDIVYVP